MYAIRSYYAIQAQILHLIKALQKELGMAVMFITHDMGVVAEVADRVVVMFHGDKVEEGSAAEIFDAPRHVITSYSIHYTKLYDQRNGARIDVGREPGTPESARSEHQEREGGEQARIDLAHQPPDHRREQDRENPDRSGN